MAPIPKDVMSALAAQTNLEQAVDILEEHVVHRRAKGDSLYEVSASLADLQTRLPRLGPAIVQAQYVTNVPPSTDLTPSTGGGHAASASPAALLAHLLSEPMPSVQSSREVILEFVMAREARLREKKPGRGGKGTLGNEGFEEIAAQLRDIEDGLRGTGVLVRNGLPRDSPTPDEDLDQNRQMGLALVLSLRMLLSYFTLPELARQLLVQVPADAERTLVQHVRRRAAGEGRFGVGCELEYVESLTLTRRPALRPAFRSARARTYLPPRATYPVSLPAPSKSACIKLLSAFVRDVELAGANAAIPYMRGGALGMAAVPERTNFLSRRSSPKSATSANMGSPVNSSPVGSPIKSSHAPLPSDPSPVENYSLELISEYLTREKREYMLKNKWAKSGREQLSKDLGEIEYALCVIHKTFPSPNAPSLVPTFLLCRRIFALGPSPLPNSVTSSFYDMLPMPPDPDSMPLREPTVSSTTASLYVNPRLPDEDALDAIEELLESEREKGVNAQVGEEKTRAWLEGLVDQISKRFPDGSYETAFERARHLAVYPRVFPDSAIAASAFPSRTVSGSSLGHRRSKSSTASTMSPDSRHVALPPMLQMSPTARNGRSHMRSASLPMASPIFEKTSPESVDSHTGTATTVRGSSPTVRLGSVESEELEEQVVSDSSSVDSEFARRVAPLPQQAAASTSHGSGSQHVTAQPHAEASSTAAHDGPRPLPTGYPGMSGSSASAIRHQPPPMLNFDVPGHELDLGTGLGFPNTPQKGIETVTTPASVSSGGGAGGGTSGGGWWDVVSDVSAQSPGFAITPSDSMSDMATTSSPIKRDISDPKVASTAGSPTVATQQPQAINDALARLQGQVPKQSTAKPAPTLFDALFGPTPGASSSTGPHSARPADDTGATEWIDEKQEQPATVPVPSSMPSMPYNTPATGPSASFSAAQNAYANPSPLPTYSYNSFATSPTSAGASPITIPTGLSASPASSHTTPRLAPAGARFDDAPPLPSGGMARLPHIEHMPQPPASDFGPAGPKTAGASAAPTSSGGPHGAWPAGGKAHDPPRDAARERERDAARARAYGSLNGVRPPPVPVTIDRPSFPSLAPKAASTPSSRNITPTAAGSSGSDAAEQPGSSTKSKFSFGRSVSNMMSSRNHDSRQHARNKSEHVRKVSGQMHTKNEHARAYSHSHSQRPQVPSPSHARAHSPRFSPPASDHNHNYMYNRAADHAHAHAPVPSAAHAAQQSLEHMRSMRRPPGKIANNPEKWNRDMVVGIMGPPAERR